MKMDWRVYTKSFSPVIRNNSICRTVICDEQGYQVNLKDECLHSDFGTYRVLRQKKWVGRVKKNLGTSLGGTVI